MDERKLEKLILIVFMQKSALRYTATQNSLFVIQLIYSLKNKLTAAQTLSSNILGCVYSHGMKTILKS